MESSHPPRGAPHSLNKGLQDRLIYHKENLDPQASASLELNRTSQSNANCLRDKGVLAHRQSSAVTSRPVLDQEGRIRIPAVADRRKQLEEWVAAKGKKYKRPPMAQLQKQGVKPSCRKGKAKEKQENPEQHGQTSINNILTECPKFTEESVHAEEVSAVLYLVPQAEKFAKFWICQAKLLAWSVTFDVLQLYKEAVIAGAEPVKESRETILDISKDAGQELEVNLSIVVLTGARAGEKAGREWEPRTHCPGDRHPIPSSPGLVGRPMTSLPPSIKLLVTPASRRKEFLEGSEVKFLTPVRRSLRIERARSTNPKMLKDPVVSSLREILEAEKETRFFLRRNTALPEVTELEGVSSYPLRSS